MDCHTHPFEKDESLEGMRGFVVEAERKGIAEMTFTEHGPLLPGRSYEFFQRYADRALRVKGESSVVKVNFGIELDYHPAKVDEAAALIGQYPFDYVLGSVHAHTSLYSNEIAGMPFYETAEFALNMILNAVNSGLFDAISHFDFFRILSPTPENYDPRPLKDHVLEVFRAMESKGVWLEVNSSSLRRPFRSLHPAPEILKWADDFDLTYVYGSDAHEARFVGAGYEAVLAAMTPSQCERLLKALRIG